MYRFIHRTRGQQYSFVSHPDGTARGWLGEKHQASVNLQFEMTSRKSSPLIETNVATQNVSQLDKSQTRSHFEWATGPYLNNRQRDNLTGNERRIYPAKYGVLLPNRFFSLNDSIMKKLATQSQGKQQMVAPNGSHSHNTFWIHQILDACALESRWCANIQIKAK